MTRRVLPGVAVAGAVAALAFGLTQLISGLPALAICVLLGALLANVARLPQAIDPGLQFASKKLLRLGIVLLGLQLSLRQLADLGLPRLLLVVATVIATFGATVWLGRRMKISRPLYLLTATGFSICGASAIAGAKNVVEADDDETAYAIALVTLCGSMTIVVMPLLARLVGLHDEAYGSWVGASVHDVAQVVAAGSIGGAAALHVAVVVKLTRVVLLAPLLAAMSLHERRRRHAGPTVAVPVVPLFVAGFLGAIVLRTTGALPLGAIEVIGHVQNTLLAMALVGLGYGVRVKRFQQLGATPLLLAFSPWFIVAAVSYGGVLLVG